MVKSETHKTLARRLQAVQDLTVSVRMLTGPFGGGDLTIGQRLSQTMAEWQHWRVEEAGKMAFATETIPIMAWRGRLRQRRSQASGHPQFPPIIILSYSE